MKIKLKLWKICFCITFLLCTKSYAQPGVDWQLIGNAIVPGSFLGTTNGQALNMQTMLGTPIRFRTNFGLAPFGAGNRMIITDGGFGNGAGFIAMGNNLPNGFVPTARLHLNQTGGGFPIPLGVYMRYTNLATLPTATDGFATGIDFFG